MDCQPVVKGEAGVAVAEAGGCGVALQLRGESRQRVGEALQEREYLFRREQVFHHHEAHEVQAEITPDGGRCNRGAQPVRVGRPAGRGGLVHAAAPGGLGTLAVRHRRLEVVGALVLAGIAVGAVLGLVFQSARPVMVEGSVPTAVFAVGCLASLRGRPLMFGFAMEFLGPDSAKGRDMTALWQYDGYRHVWRVITAAWGAALLLEAALRVVVIYNTSAGTALTVSKVAPFVFVGVMSAWTVAYGSYRKRKGEQAHLGIIG